VYLIALTPPYIGTYLHRGAGRGEGVAPLICINLICITIDVSTVSPDYMRQAMPHVTIVPYNAITPTDVAATAPATVALTDHGLLPVAAMRASSQRRNSLASVLAITLSALRAIMPRDNTKNHRLPVYSSMPSPMLRSILPMRWEGVRSLS